jgi:hypothetical protein
MTDNEWILYCITAEAVIIAAITLIVLFGNYPIHEAINQTHFLVTGAP